MSSQIDVATYTAAHQTAVLVDRSDLGMLKIGGETRLDLLDRMSTNRVKDLTSGTGAATVLTTDIGRIIDRLLVYAGSDTAYALTSENNADNIGRYLMGFVFFNDDFHLQNISAETVVLAVYGPRAQHVLGEVVGFPEVDIPLHHWREAELLTTGGPVTAYLHRTDPIQGLGYYVMGESKHKEALWRHLLDAGLVPADAAAFDYLRIEAGLPRFGQELTQDYIPLEANLWDDVSFSKGCYIGQEIIARMESRGKLAKQLVPLQLSAPAAPGSEISAQGRKAGTLTSVAEGPPGVSGLGYVKTAVLEARTPLQCGQASITLREVPARAPG